MEVAVLPESLAPYIPIDRLLALARGQELPDRANGAVLFADISGFTPLTEALAQELGPRRGAEELTHHLNAIYDALISEVHRFQGSVIGFSGDAITCWFDSPPVQAGQVLSPGIEQASLRAATCGLAIQQAMDHFVKITTPSGAAIALAIKEAVAAGPARRFRVGDPAIRVFDVLAGALMDHVAEAEELAHPGEVALSAEAAVQLASTAILDRRMAGETGQWRVVVTGLAAGVEATPWPDPKSVALDEAQARPWLLPPVYERLRAGQGRFLAEIRPAAALFLKFGGLDYDADEAAGQKLDGYIRWVQRILAEYEGYLIQLTTGDKGSYLYAAFGAPLAHDDDARRAVAAALKLKSPPPELSFVSAPQIGVSQGQMRTGDYGSSTRRTYGVLGDEVNVAARLMGQAEPGQVLVGDRVAAAAGKHYRLRCLGVAKIRGKKESLVIFAVQDGHVPTPQRPATIFESPLVGRHSELAQMDHLLAAAQAGRGQVLRLEGAAGIGKSHLAAELVERAWREHFRVAVGACESTAQHTAYYPWRQAFCALFDLADPGHASGQSADAPGVSPSRNASETSQRQIDRISAIVHKLNPTWLVRLPLLGDLLDLPVPDNATTAVFDPQLRREALSTLAIEMLRAWAGQCPLLLLMEDAHWLDEASQGLALALSRAIADTPILLVEVHRSRAEVDEPPSPELDRLPYYRRLHLDELSPEGVAMLAAGRLQGQLTPLALSLIQGWAQGNPFFVEELVTTLRETGRLECLDGHTWTLSQAMINTLGEANCLAKEGEGWIVAPQASLSAIDLGIPDSIHGIVLSRIDRLPEVHKLILKVASVIGHTFEFDLLAKAHPAHPGRAALLEQMGLMEERGLIRLEAPQPRPVYRFKHNITQEVAYATLLRDQQRDLHRAVGEALETLQPEAVERLADHYHHGEVRPKALFYLDKAARKSQREYANETAMVYYRQALALEERWEWLKGQSEVLHVLSRRQEEWACLQRLAAHPATPPFEVAYLQGQYHEAVGEYSQARADVERALAISRERKDRPDEARCLAQLGLIARRQGDHNSAMAWYDQTLTLLAAQAISPDEKLQASVVQALIGLGIALRQAGEFDQARAFYERALTLSQATSNRPGEAEALNHLGVTAFYQRDFAQAEQYHRQALTIRRTIGDRTGEGISLFNLAIAFRDRGDYSRAEATMAETLLIQQATGNRWEEINVRNGLGGLYILMGDTGQARHHFEQGLELSTEIGDKAGQAYLLCNLGWVACDRGDYAAARRLLADGLALARAQSNKDLEAYLLSYLSTVNLHTHKLKQAIKQARRALALRQELGQHPLVTGNLAALAMANLAAGEMAQALDYARQALAILADCGGIGPEFPHHDYFCCYRVLRAAGQQAEALATLGSAYRLLMAQAEKITDPAMQRAFLEGVSMNREIMEEYTLHNPG
jgi:adenylate cyclase